MKIAVLIGVGLFFAVVAVVYWYDWNHPQTTEEKAKTEEELSNYQM